MRAIVETGPVVAYLYVLSATDPASLLGYDGVTGAGLLGPRLVVPQPPHAGTQPSVHLRMTNN